MTSAAVPGGGGTMAAYGGRGTMAADMVWVRVLKMM